MRNLPHLHGWARAISAQRCRGAQPIAKLNLILCSLSFSLHAAKIQNDLRILTERLARINDNLARKISSRNEYDKTIQETEAAYSKVRPLPGARDWEGDGGEDGVPAAPVGAAALQGFLANGPRPAMWRHLRRRQLQLRRQGQLCGAGDGVANRWHAGHLSPRLTCFRSKGSNKHARYEHCCTTLLHVVLTHALVVAFPPGRSWSRRKRCCMCSSASLSTSRRRSSRLRKDAGSQCMINTFSRCLGFGALWHHMGFWRCVCVRLCD